MTGLVFLATVVGTSIILGLPAAVHPTLRHLSLPARASLAWATGSLVLTTTLTCLSAIGLNWTVWWVLLACTSAIAITSWTARKGGSAQTGPRPPGHVGVSLRTVCFALIAGGGMYAFVFGVATSADLSYFWGVKAIHFALERGIDFELLKQPYMIHLHPNYPPLWPVLLGWGAIVARTTPWIAIPLLTWVCLTAAAAVIFSVLEHRLGGRGAAAVTCLWYGVLSTMMVTSFSGGNADGPLILYLSIALVVILTEAEAGPQRLRWIAGVAFAGAVFTKSEGAVAVALIAIGTAVRDVIWRRPAVLQQTLRLISPAAAMFALWIAVRIVHRLPLTDPIRESVFHFSFDHLGLILRVCTRFLATGVVAVALIVPLVTLLVVGRRSLARAIPGVVTALGILVFAISYYLHAADHPLELIVWTFPRLIQPALTAWILGLGVAAFSVAGERAAGSVLAKEPTR
jgi:hypothetical protein